MPEGLQGASCITGGTFRGHAHGNVFNFADEPDTFCGEGEIRPKMGKVLLYTALGDPETTKPTMSLKHNISPTLAPILTKLALQYTKIDGMFFLLISLICLKEISSIQCMCLGLRRWYVGPERSVCICHGRG
jgi:hypothetical protein